ncbi:MAG: MarR family transcriptional regulator, partial [Gemmatimonadaceae bacterium]
MTSPRSSIQEELQQARAFDNPREEVFLATLRTGALLKRPAAKVVEEHGLSLAQYNVLRILRGAGASGLPTLTIRERMIEEAAGITRLVDKLEGAGLVRRERGASADRRQVFCRITDAGQALLVRLDPLVNTAVNAVLVQ